jgi:hypothetical protein
MMNAIESMPAALAAAQAGGAAEPGAAAALGTQLAEGGGSDMIAPNPVALGFAYTSFVLPEQKGAIGLAGNGADGGPESAIDEELAQRYGPSLALIRAALPPSMKGQFLAQLAAYDGAPGGDPAAEEGNRAPSESEVAALVQAGMLGESQALQSVSATRLARYVSRYGAGKIASALDLAHVSPAATGPGSTPQSVPGSRAARREDEDSRKRRDPAPRPELDSNEAPAATPPPDAPAGYTIEDVVRFGGETVAIHRFDTRSLPWPS